MTPVVDRLIREAVKHQLVVDGVADKLPNRRTYRDLASSLGVMYRYIQHCVPEALKDGARIVEVGPGIGSFMVIAAEHGAEVSGEELDPILAPVVAAYKVICEAWDLNIRYTGFHRYLWDPWTWGYVENSVDIFHFRGSLDGVVRSCLTSHTFTSGDTEAVTRISSETAQELMRLCGRALKPEGFIHVQHNAEGAAVERAGMRGVLGLETVKGPGWTRMVKR